MIVKASLLKIILLFIFTFLAVDLFAQSKEVKYGYVVFRFNIEDVFIVVDDDFLGSIKYNPKKPIKLEAGKRKLTLVNKDINDFDYHINIFPDSTIISEFNIQSFTRKPRSSYNVLNEGRNIVINTEAEGQIYINEDFVGVGSTSVLLSPGKHRLEIVHPKSGTLKFSVNSTWYQVQEFSRYNQNENPPSTFRRFIPGFSYLSTKQYRKAALTYLSLGALSYIAIEYNKSFNDLNSKFDEFQFKYLNAESVLELENNRLAAINTIDELETKNNQITYSLIGIGIVYAITTFDGFRKPRGGYEKRIAINPHFEQVNSSITPSLQISASF